MADKVTIGTYSGGHRASRSRGRATHRARLSSVRSDDALHALDRATRAIAGELDIDRVLQLIVDSVRDLVEARYAALGTFDARGRIERFITSGISDEVRRRIGPLPQGHGLLGTIIRDGVTLRVPDIAAHPDSHGFPPEHPPMRSLLGVPIGVGGRTVGNLYLTDKEAAVEFSDADQELVEMFASHAGIAIENARLHQEVQKLAIVDERLRISRDLHDGIIQSIYAVSLSLEDVPDLIDESASEAASAVDRAIDRLHTTIADIRTFIVGLGPEDEAGLRGALESMAHELLGASEIELSVDVSGAETLDGRLSPEAGHELSQIAREALSNVARHSGASRASLSLVVEGDDAILEIRDDGTGFDPRQRLGSGHFGLANLRDRAAAVAGTLAIESEPGEGTRIIVRLPLGSPERPS
jgi:signal transduction histidine kinase